MRDDDERLRHAIRVGNIGIFDHNHENDFIYWSSELRQIYGWDAELPATLSKILSHVHPDDIERVAVAVRKAHDPAGDGYFDIEHRIIDQQGRLRWVQTRSRTHFSPVAGKLQASRTIGAVQDTTERQVADERLRVLDTVLSSSTQAVAVADRRGTLTFANAALCRLWGYPDDEVLLGRSLFDFWQISGDPESALMRVRENRIQNVEAPARRVDGTAFNLGITAEAVCDATGALAQVLVTFRDITESKRIQDALRLKDQAIASSFIGIAMADASENIIYANDEFLRLAGFAREEDVLGRSLWQFCDPNDARTISSRLAEGGGFQGEIAGSGREGPSLYLNVSARALRGTRGELANIVCSFADVTDRKRLEAQLVHAQKMESVGRLAGGIAHDFNNLLTVILGGLQLGLVELAPEHPGSVYLAEAAEAAQSAATLTRQLLAFSRKEIILPKSLDLNEVIRRIEKMILRLVGEDVQLVTICGQNIAPILFDPGQVEQIILNLAVNARDAMANGGRLTIETSNVYLDGGYSDRHAETRTGMHVLLAVSDNGAGLTAEARAHLFEPFFTTKGPGKGTGLGLAMVYGAVQQNGGRIEVYSEPGQGTTFKIYLPAVAEAPTTGTTRALSSAGARRTMVVLVEDDRRVRKFATDVLTRFGHDVQAFPSGEDALAAIPSIRPEPELLVTDVVMPGINGRVLAERVSALLPRIRVLFVSGYTQNVIVNHGVLKDGVEFLAKPYSVEQLARRVREVMESATPAPSPKA